MVAAESNVENTSHFNSFDSVNSLSKHF